MTTRREFITLLGGAMGAAWPEIVKAQSAKPLVGFINNGSAAAFSSLASAFQSGLEQTGYIDGQNVTVDRRWAEGDYSQLPIFVAEFVQRRASIIVATGGTASPMAAQPASATIPVVFAIGADPIKFGLVNSLNRPGGNMTGVSFLANSLLPKQVEVLHEIVGNGAILGFLVNPANPNAEADTRAVVAAATLLQHKTVIERAETQAEITNAFAALVAQRIDALLIFPDALFTSSKQELASLASKHKLPALYNSAFAVAGGLVGYGAKQSEAYRNAGIYTGRILKGDKPADLPVMQSSSVELVVNLRAAKILGIEMPQTLLARADEVIE